MELVETRDNFWICLGVNADFVKSKKDVEDDTIGETEEFTNIHEQIVMRGVPTFDN